MSIKHEIHSIKNSHGTGEERNFACIFEYEPMTANNSKNTFFQMQRCCKRSRATCALSVPTFRQSQANTRKKKCWRRKQYFLTINRIINRCDMKLHFGLRQSAAQRWLKHFTDIGVLKKDGARNSPVHFCNM